MNMPFKITKIDLDARTVAILHDYYLKKWSTSFHFSVGNNHFEMWYDVTINEFLCKARRKPSFVLSGFKDALLELVKTL